MTNMNKELLQQALDALVSAAEHTMPDGYKHLGAAKRLIDAAIAQPEQPAACLKCGGAMALGQAITQTFGGMNDFIGDKTVCTISPSGPGKLVSCMKCKQCGWSTS